MNNIAILPQIAIRALQLQNVKREVVKKHDIKTLNKDDTKDTNNDIKNELNEESNTSSLLDQTQGEIAGAESETTLNNSAISAI
jgi:hypothetical protein